MLHYNNVCLEAFGYDPKDLAARLEAILEQRQAEGRLTAREARQLLAEYRGQFDTYTYLT